VGLYIDNRVYLNVLVKGCVDSEQDGNWPRIRKRVRAGTDALKPFESCGDYAASVGLYSDIPWVRSDRPLLEVDA